MSSIIYFFTNIFTLIIDLVSPSLSWFLSLLSSSIDLLLAPIADALPDLSGYWSYLDSITPYTSFINHYFPLHEASILIAAYFVFIIAFLSCKLIIKLFIPFVG